MKDVAMFVLILWDSQQSSVVAKMMLPRSTVRCLLCLLISTVFGYRRQSEDTYCEYELQEGVPIHGLVIHLYGQGMATISSVAASRTSFLFHEYYSLQIFLGVSVLKHRLVQRVYNLQAAQLYSRGHDQ
jgi:hypothetical protein